MLFNRWKRRITARTQISSMLNFARLLRDTSPIYKQIMAGNRFWDLYDQEEVMLGRLVKSRVFTSTKEFEEMEEMTRDNLEKDLREFSNTLKKDCSEVADKGIHGTLNDHTPEEKATLEFLMEWGRQEAGLKYISEKDGTIYLTFAEKIGYYGISEKIKSDSEDFLLEIAEAIQDRQRLRTASRAGKPLSQNYLNSLKKARSLGLPSNLQSVFSYRDELYQDCFVITPRGDIRVADIILDEKGAIDTVAAANIGRVLDYGVKIWDQVFENELVVRFMYWQYVGEDNATYYCYNYDVVVMPPTTTNRQVVGLTQLASNLLVTTTGNHTGSIPTQFFAWPLPYSRSFMISSDFKLIINSFKETMPEYYEQDEQYINSAAELIVHVLNDQGQIVDYVEPSEEQCEGGLEVLAVSEVNESGATQLRESSLNELTEIINSAEEANDEIKELVTEIAQDTDES